MLLTNQPRKFAVPLPAMMQKLPIDKRGFPIPAFVAWVKDNYEVPAGKGEPDFRVMNSEFYWQQLKAGPKAARCWICGGPMFRYKAFVIGPMCCVNGINSEPPSHPDCARFAAQACPFLSMPLARRNEKGLEHAPEVAGIMIKRNPGCCAVWITDTWKLFHAGNGYLIEMGAPIQLSFYANGRLATTAEVDESVRTGLPLLQEAAAKDGPDAIRVLEHQIEKFNRMRRELTHV